MGVGQSKGEIIIYNLDDIIRNQIKSIKNSAISERNKELLFKFIDDLISEGLGKARISKYMYTVKKIMIMVKKDFEKITEKDVRKLVKNIEESSFALWTKHDYKVVIKRFVRWLRKTEDFPEEVKWIKTGMKKNCKILPQDILTQQEIINLIRTAKGTRDKALISILYESGMRIKELLTLRIRHVEFDSYGARIICSGKTGMRRIRIVASVPYLKRWLNEHPKNDDPNSPLWLSWNGFKKVKDNEGSRIKYESEAICYRRVSDLLRDIALKCGIKKRVNPHSFRHARATHLANKLTEAQMKEFFGWTQSSEMASIYVHLSGRDTEDAILKIYGKKKSDVNREEEFSEKICPGCKTENQIESKYCDKCSAPLDIQTAIEMDKRLTEALKIMNERMTKLESVLKK